MATKSRKRSRTKPSAAKAPPPELAADKVAAKLEIEMRRFVGWQSDFSKQQRKVEEAREALKAEELTLETMAKAHREILAFLGSAKLADVANAKPWDAKLRETVARVTATKSVYNPRTYKHEKKPTGGKPWNVLKRTGATDAQIIANLKHVERSYGNFRLEIDGSIMAFTDCSHNARRKLIAGAAAVAVEVRRVMGIPLPVAGAVRGTSGDKSGTKKPARSRKKKPAAAAKSSTAAKKPEKPAAKPVAKKSRSRKKSSEPAAAPEPALGSRTEEELLAIASDADAAELGKPPLLSIDFGEDKDAACEDCGCTPEQACAGGCYWTDHPDGDPERWLCSKCAEKRAQAGAKAKRPSRSRSKRKEPALAGSKR